MIFQRADLRALARAVAALERDQADHHQAEWRKRREDANPARRSPESCGRKKRLSLAFAEEKIDAVYQLGAGEGLGDVIIRAKLVAAEHVFVLDFGGEQNHRNGGGLGF